jgi:NTP pyrophosphatase (non-canonical NTP hydrolase)
MKINNFIMESHKQAIKSGFWDQERNVGEMLMLIVSELGEAIESHRNRETVPLMKEIGPTGTIIGFCMDKKRYNKGEWRKWYELHLKNCFETEIADTFIRLADLCGGLNIDIEKFIEMKMEYNKGREKLHGKRY